MPPVYRRVDIPTRQEFMPIACQKSDSGSAAPHIHRDNSDCGLNPRTVSLTHEGSRLFLEETEMTGYNFHLGSPPRSLPAGRRRSGARKRAAFSRMIPVFYAACILSAFLPSPLYPADGWQVDLRLTNDPESSFPPPNNCKYIAVDGAGRVHVVWADSRDKNYEIYHKFLVGRGLVGGYEADLRSGRFQKAQSRRRHPRKDSPRVERSKRRQHGDLPHDVGRLLAPGETGLLLGRRFVRVLARVRWIQHSHGLPGGCGRHHSDRIQKLRPLRVVCSRISLLRRIGKSDGPHRGDRTGRIGPRGMVEHGRGPGRDRFQ